MILHWCVIWLQRCATIVALVFLLSHMVCHSLKRLLCISIGWRENIAVTYLRRTKKNIYTHKYSSAVTDDTSKDVIPPSKLRTMRRESRSDDIRVLAERHTKSLINWEAVIFSWTKHIFKTFGSIWPWAFECNLRAYKPTRSARILVIIDISQFVEHIELSE